MTTINTIQPDRHGRKRLIGCTAIYRLMPVIPDKSMRRLATASGLRSPKGANGHATVAQEKATYKANRKKHSTRLESNNDGNRGTGAQALKKMQVGQIDHTKPRKQGGAIRHSDAAQATAMPQTDRRVKADQKQAKHQVGRDTGAARATAHKTDRCVSAAQEGTVRRVGRRNHSLFVFRRHDKAPLPVPDRGTDNRSLPGSQTGAALTMALLLTASVSLGLWLGTGAQTRHDDLDAASLNLARQAVLAWSASYFQRTGSGRRNTPRAKVVALPCPDLGKSLYPGASAGVCGSRHHASIGLLPWRSLGIGPIHDGSRSCLWYWVSGDYKNSPYPTQLNQRSAGGWVRQGNRLVYHDTVGATPAGAQTHIAAIIVAPGAAVDGQRRSPQTLSCTHVGDAKEYLESSDWHSDLSAGGPGIYKHRTVSLSGPGNDRLVYITHDEIWHAALNNANVTQLLQEDFPALMARCAVQVLQAGASASALPTPAVEILRHSLCADLYDRRARELAQHWGDFLSVTEQPSGALAFGIRLSLPRQRIPTEFSQQQSPDDSTTSVQHYCMQPGHDDINPCLIQINHVEDNNAEI